MDQNNSSNESFRDYEILPKTSDTKNFEIIENIFNDKLNQYDTEGYFFQSYEPSLQATYYALYILKAIDKLDDIDKSAVGDYIMSHYNLVTHIFMDRYTLRYLDTEITYYPLTTLLETNCYAILSLSLLDQLTRIDSPDAINFILSCSDPTTHAFIGQPYDACPSGILKVPTMDNTYYAVLTLETLGVDLGDIQHDITDFIGTLQYTDGGFLNDDDSFFSLGFPLITPNIFSSYYCIKTLEIFGLESSIDTDKFHQYLDSLYDDQSFIFQYSSFDRSDQFNIVASALGLELSDLTPLSSTFFLDSGNKSGVINVILNNRNFLGNWDSSTIYDTHELIDTFQIVRSLNEDGVISQLSPTDKNEIYNSLSYYNNSGGFCLLSKDYTSVGQYYSVINSFYLYNRIADIDLQGVYEILRKTCLYNGGPNAFYFLAVTNIPLKEPITNPPSIPGMGIRSYPIEYSTLGKRELLKEWERRSDHSSMYWALDTLKKIFKLDDFEQERDLTDMLTSVVNSQFLENGYSNYGAFLPSIALSSSPASYQNSEITLEHSYYAVKCMELLTDYLNLGPITDLSFDETPLNNYILGDIVNDGTNCYHNPQYTDNIETILENTYYMIYILNAINMYNQDNQKIKNYVLQNLNYSNIKNIYYSYKISEILDLDISFDVDKTHMLVQEIYSEEINEFYLTTNRRIIEQEAFLWICDMAKNDKIRINCQYSEFVMLGATKNITVSLSNIVLRNFGHHYLVKYESNQIGTIVLDNMLDSTYQNSLTVPIDPKNSPQIVGNISVYKGLTLVSRLNISFRTYHVFSYFVKIQDEDNFFLIEFDVSYRFSTGYVPTPNTRIFATILKNDMYKEVVDFGRWDYSEYSTFTLLYEYPDDAEYSLNVTLVDQFHPEGTHLYNLTRAGTASENDEGDGGDDNDDEQSINILREIDWQYTIGLGITIGVLFAVIIGVKIRANEKLKKTRERESIYNPNTNSTIGPNNQDNQEHKSRDIGFSNSNSLNRKGSLSMFNNEKVVSHNEPIQNRRGNSLINVLKRNKKELFLIIMGILVFTLLYLYGELLFYFMMGGIGIVILGGIVAFYGGIKKGIKISGIGLLIITIGVFIFVLRSPINLF